MAGGVVTPPETLTSFSQAPPRWLIVSAFGLLCLIWGTTWSMIQIGLQGIPPFAGVSIRFAIAAVILIGFCRLKRIPLGTSRTEWILWVVNAILAFAVSYGVVYWAEQWLPSGLTSVLFATYPLFVAVLAHLFLPAERIGWIEAVGIVTAFGGVALIYSEDLSALGGPQVATAAAVMLLSPAAASVASVSIKRWGSEIHPFSMASVPMALTAVVMGVVAFVFERDRSITWNVTSVGALLYLALLGSAVTFSIYYWLLVHLPAKRLALIAYTIPIVAVLIGALRGEPMTARILAGSALVIGAVALTTQVPIVAGPPRG